MSDGNTGSRTSERCEKDPSHLTLGIAIDNLIKVGFHPTLESGTLKHTTTLTCIIRLFSRVSGLK